VPEPRRPCFCKKELMYLVDNGIISDLAVNQIIISGVVFILSVSYFIKPKYVSQGCHSTRKCKR
jgi:hypothetical protein